MAKAIKFKNDIFLDSNNIIHNKKRLSEILNYNTGIVKINSWPATTSITTEQTLGSTIIPNAGTYLFWANIPLNYYGQSGRELYLRLKVNDVEKWYSVGICNTYIYTLTMAMFTIQTISSNSNIKITVQDPAGKTYAVGSFTLYYLKIL